MSTVFLALGGNLGDVEAAFEFAEKELEKNGVSIRKKSKIRITAPVDCPPGSPDFRNAVWRCEYAGTPFELLSLCQRLEIAAGRPANHGRHAPRTLDLDIILFDDLRINSEELTIPHPRAAERDFVAIPLAEVRCD